MMHFRPIQNLLGLALLLASLSPAFAASPEETPLNINGLTPTGDQTYFQEVANKWLPANADSNSAAVLKGGISAVNKSYSLGSGDVLIITIPDFYNEEEKDRNFLSSGPTPPFSITAVVRDRGEVTIPPFGTFHIEGMTVAELSHMLEEMSKFYLLNPRVFISLKALRPYTVFINGEVDRPGPYQTLNAPEQAYLAYADSAGAKLDSQQMFMGRISVMIGKAGGIMPSSDIEHVRVSNALTGKNMELNLMKMLEGDSSQDVLLEPGDEVHIPRIDRTNFQSELVAASILAPKQQVVHILGYATRNTGFSSDGITPDLTISPRNMFLLSALSKVNVDPRANLRNIYIFRRRLDNTLEKYHVDATKENFALVPHDVIYIPHLRQNYQWQNIISSVSQLLSGSSSWARVIQDGNNN